MFLDETDPTHPAESPLVDYAWQSLRWLKMWVIILTFLSILRLLHPLKDGMYFDGWAVVNLVGSITMFTPITFCDRHMQKLFRIKMRNWGLYFLSPFIMFSAVQSLMDLLTHIPVFLDSDVLSVQIFVASVTVQVCATLCGQSAYVRQIHATRPEPVRPEGVELATLSPSQELMTTLPRMPPPRHVDMPIIMEFW